jgi:hypothetical protein
MVFEAARDAKGFAAITFVRGRRLKRAELIFGATLFGCRQWSFGSVVVVGCVLQRGIGRACAGPDRVEL